MPEPTPVLAEWAGGEQAFHRLTARFYQRVADDVLLAPVFAGMDPDHASHVAAFIAEVLGAGPTYTVTGGSHAQMITRHMGRHLTETQRRAWLALLLDTADEVGLPQDPEFRAALVGYLEWGSRLAVMNSADGASAPNPKAAMPQWTWSSPGGPYLPKGKD